MSNVEVRCEWCGLPLRNELTEWGKLSWVSVGGGLGPVLGSKICRESPNSYHKPEEAEHG